MKRLALIALLLLLGACAYRQPWIDPAQEGSITWNQEEIFGPPGDAGNVSVEP